MYMKNLKEERMTKNEWLTILNYGEYQFNSVINELESIFGYRLKNFDLIIKQRMFEFEDAFYKYDENFYYDSVVGDILLKWLFKKREHILELFASKVGIDYFSFFKRDIGKFFNIDMPTLFEKKYGNLLKEIKDFRIDDKFYQQVDFIWSSPEFIFSREQYEKNKSKLFDELIRLGYSLEFSKDQVKQLDESLAQNTFFQLKLKFMDYFYSKNISDVELEKLYNSSDEKFHKLIEENVLSFLCETELGDSSEVVVLDIGDVSVQKKKKRKLF